MAWAAWARPNWRRIWRHSRDYCALLFITASTPQGLATNLAALVGPKALNLPEQELTEQAEQAAAVLRWLQQNPGWLLILDNVDNREAAEAVESLLAQLSGGKVLITSRLAQWSGSVVCSLTITEAEPLMHRALAIDEHSFGPTHPTVAIHLNNLAQLLRDTNRLAEAEPLSRRHLIIFLDFTRSTRHTHPHLHAALNNYAGILAALGHSKAEIDTQIQVLLSEYGLGLSEDDGK